MVLTFNLSTDEYQQLNFALKDTNQVQTSILSYHQLDKHLQHWARFINEVAEGYCGLVVEYLNELYVRKNIEDVIKISPLGLKDKMMHILTPWDDRFTATTLSLPHSLESRLSTRESQQWWIRVPKHLKEPQGDIEYWLIYYRGDQLPISVEYLLTQWCQFIKEVEEGDVATVASYTDRLHIRDLLNEYVQCFSMDSHIQETLDLCDKVFESVTRTIAPPLEPSVHTSVPGLWYQRVPKQISRDQLVLDPMTFGGWVEYFSDLK